MNLETSSITIKICSYHDFNRNSLKKTDFYHINISCNYDPVFPLFFESFVDSNNMSICKRNHDCTLALNKFSIINNKFTTLSFYVSQFLEFLKNYFNIKNDSIYVQIESLMYNIHILVTNSDFIMFNFESFNSMLISTFMIFKKIVFFCTNFPFLNSLISFNSLLFPYYSIISNRFNNLKRKSLNFKGFKEIENFQEGLLEIELEIPINLNGEHFLFSVEPIELNVGYSTFEVLETHCIPLYSEDFFSDPLKIQFPS